MKKRLIAVVLTIVMLFCALPMSASAVAPSTLSELISASISSGRNYYNIPTDMTVNTDTIVPYGFTLYLPSGVKLTLNAQLTVVGSFVNYGTVINPEKLFGYSAQQYDPNYYYWFFLTHGYYPSDYYGTYPVYPGYPVYIPDAPIFFPGNITNDYLNNLYLYLKNLGYSDADIIKYISSLQGINYYSCSAPYANIVSGTTVKFNTSITLTSDTTGASIYYTTDGSTPDTTSTLYTGAIPVNKTDVVIKAIAVKSGYKNSNIITFSYKTTIPISFTDLGAYTLKLTPSLVTLVQAKVIADAATLNPDGSVSYDELLTWLRAVGVNTSNMVINEDYITNKSTLSYEDFSYVTYRALIKTPSVLSSPKNSSKETLGKLKYGSEVTATPSILRAGIMSLVEAGLFYGSDFHPKAAATRAYAFYMLAQVYNTLH
jgi:Predicted membrane protein